MNCSLPGSCVHEIFQTRILEWVAVSFSRGSSQPKDWTCVSYIGRQILYLYATREANIADSLSSAAAAALKSLQSCPTLWDPIDGSPPGSPVPGILQARTLEKVAISSSNAWKWKVKVKSLSCVRLVATPWTAAHQAPPSMGFSRQEYWSGVPLPSPLYRLSHQESPHTGNVIHAVVSSSLQPLALQHARPLCPSPSPEVCPSSCPLHWWCIQPFHPLMPSSPSALSLSQYQGLVSNMSPQKGTHGAKIYLKT